MLMNPVQFTAKNDNGSKWGGEFSGSVKKCVQKQFEIGATEVTIIDCGKLTVFNIDLNHKSGVIGGNPRREHVSESIDVSPNKDHRGQVNKNSALKMSRLLLITSPIGFILIIALMYVLRGKCEWIQYSRDSGSQTWHKELRAFDDSWQINVIEYVFGVTLDAYNATTKLAEVSYNDVPLFNLDALRNEVMKYDKCSIVIEKGPVQKFYNERLAHEFNLPKNIKIAWIVTIISDRKLENMIFSNDNILTGKVIYDSESKMANSYDYTTGIEVHKEWMFLKK